MSNWKKIALLMLGFVVPVTACHAGAEKYNAKIESNFPARALRMATVLHGEINRNTSALQKINRHTIARDYGPAMARIFMARRTTTGAPYLAGMTTASRYCWISLKQGDVCGLKKLPESQAVNGQTFDGYLFVSNWIHAGEKQYFLMITSLVAPQETVIARVTYHGGVKVLYDTFEKGKPACPLPADASIGFVSTVYRVKTLSPTRFVLYEGSYTEPTRAAILKLSLGVSSCALKVLAPSQVGGQIR